MEFFNYFQVNSWFNGIYCLCQQGLSAENWHTGVWHILHMTGKWYIVLSIENFCYKDSYARGPCNVSVTLHFNNEIVHISETDSFAKACEIFHCSRTIHYRCNELVFCFFWRLRYQQSIKRWEWPFNWTFCENRGLTWQQIYP